MGIITPIYFGIWTNCISFSSHPGLACFINNQLAEVFTQCSQDQNVDCAMVSKHHTWKRLIVINFFMNSGDTTSSCSHTCGPTIGKTTQDCFGRCWTCIPLLFMHECHMHLVQRKEMAVIYSDNLKTDFIGMKLFGWLARCYFSFLL